jgi:hypothetical protein
MLRFAAFAIACAACANNPGVARFRATAPAALVPVGPPRDARSVRVEMKPLPWWTVAESSRYFVLGFDEPEHPVTHGAPIGAMRSRDVALDAEIYDAVKCGWEIVPMGDPRACSGMTREQAMEISHDAITEARAELRAKAADAGAGVVGDVRCFAEELPAHDAATAPARLWCEGIAMAGTAAVADAIAEAQDEIDPAAPITGAPRMTPTRLVFYADGSAGMLDTKAVVGSTLGIRYAPFEVGFYLLDLQRESVVPQDNGLVGVGLTALLRHAIRGSRADAIAGVSAVAAFKNGATNPDFDGLYHGFVGVAVQSPWRIAGVAQPYAQLRAGAAFGTAVAAKTAPMLELHIGLSTPERR